MDPVSVALLTSTLTGILGGAAGEAGKQAWQALSTKVRSLLGREPAPAPAELASTLHQLASTDPDFAQWLAEWANAATSVTVVQGNLNQYFVPSMISTETPRQLPPAPTGFANRVSELSHLVTMARAPRGEDAAGFAMLTGVEGVGKKCAGSSIRARGQRGFS